MLVVSWEVRSGGGGGGTGGELGDAKWRGGVGYLDRPLKLLMLPHERFRLHE